MLLFLLEILLGSDDEIRLRSFDMLCADDVPFQNFVAGTGNVPSGLVVHPDREHLLYPLGSSIVVEGIAGKRKQAFLLVRPRFSHNSWDTYPGTHVRSPLPSSPPSPPLNHGAVGALHSLSSLLHTEHELTPLAPCWQPRPTGTRWECDVCHRFEERRVRCPAPLLFFHTVLARKEQLPLSVFSLRLVCSQSAPPQIAQVCGIWRKVLV